MLCRGRLLVPPMMAAGPEPQQRRRQGHTKYDLIRWREAFVIAARQSCCWVIDKL